MTTQECGTQETSVVLPQELITEILLRMPVKSLSRCKSVCKSWLSLISDPNFAILHFELDAARTERLLFTSELSNKVQSIDLNASLHDDSASTTFNLNFLPPKPFFVQIVGSCRGLILLKAQGNICICNPCTGVHRFVDTGSSISYISPKVSVCLHAFGYDPLTDDYLVVRMLCCRTNDLPRRILLEGDNCMAPAEYFSLRANVWKEVEAIPLYMACCFDNTLFNNAIHWLSYRYDIGEFVIVVFNLTERSFSDMPVPVGLDESDTNLGLRGQFLSLCVVKDQTVIEIWVMEEYKVPSSWTKTIVVSFDHAIKDFTPICYAKNGDIVGRDGGDGLAKLNATGQVEEHRLYSSTFKRFQIAVYTDSLLPFPC